MRLHILALTAMCGLSGCATVVPQFDIPNNEAGPTVNSIRREVECEIDEIVKNDKGLDSFLASAHDIGVAVLLNLDVTDDGALAPTYAITNGLFSFAGGASLEESRDQNFQQILGYSLADRQALMKFAGEKPVCGQSPDTNLSGDLGLKEAWNLALTGLTYTNWKGANVNGGPFGGTVTFTVKKQITATGPMWTLKHFKGPGSFLTAYETNVDKLTFAFVVGPKAKDKGAVINAATKFLETIQNGNIANSLTTISNKD